MALNLDEILKPFVWGANGAMMTPEEIAMERARADEMGAIDTSPVGHWTQGAARVAMAMAGAVRRGRADSAANARAEKGKGISERLLQALGGGGSKSGGSVAAAVPAAAGGGTSAAYVPSAHSAEREIDVSGAGVDPANWLAYSNKGATRNKPLSPKLVQALSFLPELGVGVDVFSGGQDATGPHRTGSHRHDHGNAGDVFFTKGGKRLDWRNKADIPLLQEIVRRGKAAGVTGMGAGDGYMQPGSMHIGFGTPAVWGAGGKGDNAPDWLRQAYAGGGAAPEVAGVVNALANAQAPQPTQVASLDPSAGLPQEGSIQVGPATTSAPVATPMEAPIPQPAPMPEPMAAPVDAPIAAPQQVAQAAPVDQGGGGMLDGIDPAIIEAATSEYADEGTRSMARALLQAQIARNSPEAQLDLKIKQKQYEALGQPDPSDVLAREKFAYDQKQDAIKNAMPPESYRALEQRAQAAGLEPGTPAYQKFFLSGGSQAAVTRQEPAPPAGYTFTRDADGNITGQQVIPGSPQAQEIEQAAKAQEKGIGANDIQTNVITRASKKARDILSGSSAATGTISKGLALLGESDAAELRRQIEVLKSNAKVETLQAMRDASTTGASGLGSLTQNEADMLANVAGSIDPSAGKEAVQEGLDNYERTLLQIIHGPEIGDMIFEKTREQKSKSKNPADMTDEEIQRELDGQ